MSNMETKLENHTKGENNEKEETENIYEFVDGLFLSQGKRTVNGDIRIEIDGNPRFLNVHLYFDKAKGIVEVYINKVPMGSFKIYTAQGYKYEFQQRRRVGIRNGRTLAEQFMESMCDDDRILLRKAY